MTDLSPAAQAIVTAIEKFDWEAGHFSREEIWFCSREVVAAALRAAADQVMPEEPEPRWWEPVRPHFNRQCIRRRFLAIAAELEAQ